MCIFYMYISFHRSIRNPFQSSFSTKLIVFIVIVIYASASLLNFAEFFYMKYIPYPRPGHEHLNFCSWLPLSKYSSEMLAVIIKNAVLISFAPLPILILLHISSYHAIAKSAQQFQLDNRRIHKMRKIRKTFSAVVVIFFALSVPTEIYSVTIVSIVKFYPNMMRTIKYRFHIDRFFNTIISLNSCANPLIYAKVHRRLSRCLQRIQQRRRRNERNQPSVIELRTRVKQPYVI